MRIKIPAAACAVTLAIVLSGCSDNMKKTFGLEANPPDAFQVGTQAPLSLPPELGVLPPPNPGEPRPQQVNAAQQGADALDTANALTSAPTTQSPGEQALLDQAGPAPSGDIRAQVNQNALIASKPPGFVAKLTGSGPVPAPTVDAGAEQRRLQENEALGQPATTGATPQDSNVKPGFFQSIWNAF
ncbi:hypothetical protein GCM10010909_04030 [Acidocella aquatica]|uniref:DUF3035 domain-containing protein n=1 Tax=Acidocella aquatica TaxID=1922313 RepID=A0ABQ5ZZS7_9PROT|nr:DUF3035 domain-containing protein [Acidocella aquatica]GLR65725.1 hypothetical protein GCM10010909_04030 [Acidocella aquatica]